MGLSVWASSDRARGSRRLGHRPRARRGRLVLHCALSLTLLGSAACRNEVGIRLSEVMDAPANLAEAGVMALAAAGGRGGADAGVRDAGPEAVDAAPEGAAAAADEGVDGAADEGVDGNGPEATLAPDGSPVTSSMSDGANTQPLRIVSKLPTGRGVSAATELEITFSQDVSANDCEIRLTEQAGTVVELWSGLDPQVTVSGPTVSIDPLSLLGSERAYQVEMDAGCFSAEGADSPAISGAEFSFTTAAGYYPGDLSFAPRLWLDAGDAASFSLAEGVAVWADRSGNYGLMAQGDSARMPALARAAFNGKPAVRFDGIDDALSLNTVLPLSSYEGFVVWQAPAAAAAAAAQPLLVNGRNFTVDYHRSETGGAVGACFQGCSSGSDQYYAPFLPPPSGDTRTLWGFGFDLRSTSLFSSAHGGALVFEPLPTTAPDEPVAPLLMGGNQAECQQEGGCYFRGDIAEVVLYDRVLTAPERAAVGAALRAKWAILPPTCGENEVQGPSGICYYLGAGGASFSRARALCRAHGAGWDLATIRSQQELDFILSQIKEDRWIGAQAALGAGEWLWVNDGFHFWSGGASGSVQNGAFVAWASGEPTGGPAENCVRMAHDSQMWADTLCISLYPPVCQGP